MTMEKILFITGFFPLLQGGAELQAFFLADVFKNKGHQVSFVFRDHWGKSQEECLYQYSYILHPVKPKPVNFFGFGNILFLERKQLRKILEQVRPNIIYVRGVNPYYVGEATCYCQKKRSKLILHIASDKNVQKPINQWLKPWLIPEIKFLQYGIKNADIIIAQTKYQAKELKNNYSRIAEVVPNGHPVPDDCTKTKDRLSILWVANWKPLKQPEVFVQLVESINSHQNVEFIMLGRVGKYETLVKKAISCGIKVIGEVANDEVNDFFDKGHLLVNTSKQEGFSNTFIQAWLRRVPVVSLYVDPDNVLKKERIGYCTGNFTELISTVEGIVNEPECLQSMGARARAYAVKNHALNNMNKIIKLMFQ